MDLRGLIIERVSENGGVGGTWVLDVYCYLLGRGFSADDAIKAMSSFVDEVLAIKAPKVRRVE